MSTPDKRDIAATSDADEKGMQPQKKRRWDDSANVTPTAPAAASPVPSSAPKSATASDPPLKKNISDIFSKVASIKASLQDKYQKVATPISAKPADHPSSAPNSAASVKSEQNGSAPNTSESIARPTLPSNKETMDRVRQASALMQVPKKQVTPMSLRLDDQGREVDEYGNLIKRSFALPVTLKVNKAKLEKEAEKEKKKHVEDATPKFIDPRLAASKGRRYKTDFNFFNPGKFIEKGKNQRAKALLSEIAEKNKMETGSSELNMEDPTILELVNDSERKVADPVPTVEWWDQVLLKGPTYPSAQQTTAAEVEIQNEEKTEKDAMDTKEEESTTPGAVSNPELNATYLRIDKITSYVEHPIPVEPRIDNDIAPPLALMLTKRERKKLKTRRKLEAAKDMQEKIQAGLIPPPPPKVKLSSLMRVLGTQAIQNPTQIEAEVRKQVEQRKREHERRNQTQKLTKEQKKEKFIRKFKEDTTKEHIVSVYRVDDLSKRRFRSKIELNANKYLLHGAMAVTSEMSVVVVEGGQKSIRRFSGVMLRRIKWDSKDDDEEEEEEEENGDEEQGDSSKTQNSCVLIWQGVSEKPYFSKFTYNHFEKLEDARQLFKKHSCENFFLMARNHKRLQSDEI